MSIDSAKRNFMKDFEICRLTLNGSGNGSALATISNIWSSIGQHGSALFFIKYILSTL